MSRSASHVYEPPAGRAPARGALPTSPLVFDRDSVRAVDQAAISEYGMPGIVLMENASRALADQAMKMLDDLGETLPVVLIVCGTGNNGGDGYAMARHLHNRGVEVALAPLGEPAANSDAAVNEAICRKMNLPRIAVEQLDEFAGRTHISLIVDAIFGTGLDRPVTGRAANVIEWINKSRRPVLAVDVPSGIDCNSGEPLGVAVRADCTVTFVGPKVGFLELAAEKLIGRVVVADIGVPMELVQRFGRPVAGHPEVPEHDQPTTSQSPTAPPRGGGQVRGNL